MIQFSYWRMAELNGLEPSSAWLTTKCLTPRPQFRTVCLVLCTLFVALCSWYLVLSQNTKNKVQRTKFVFLLWVGRRELHPHLTRSRCAALLLSYDPRKNCRLPIFDLPIGPGFDYLLPATLVTQPISDANQKSTIGNQKYSWRGRRDSNSQIN